MEKFDITAHRRTGRAHYGTGGLLRRIVWALAAPAFRFSPRLCYGWRNLLLRAFGAKIGRGVRVYPSAKVFAPWSLVIEDDATVSWNVTVYNLEMITIGARSIISQNVHLCTGNHDFRQPHLPFANEPIAIGPDCWICADAFIGPGVTVGRLAVVGARAVVTIDVPERTIVAGNPARAIGARQPD